MARRVLTLTGVPALKDAPRSTSTSALHRHRPVRDHDAGHGRAAAPRASEALGVTRQKSTSTRTFRDPEELLRMALLLTHHPQRSPKEHLRSTFIYVDLSEEGRSVHFYVIFCFTWHFFEMLLYVNKNK